MNITTYADQLRQVKEILLQQGWTKQVYYQANSDRVCACLHGAAQRVCNPVVRKIFLDFEGLKARHDAALSPAVIAAVAKNTAEAALAASSASAAAAVATAAARGDAAIAASSAALRRRRARVVAPTFAARGSANDPMDAIKKIWASRPDWVRKETNHGDLNLHYILGIFKMTAWFNDNQTNLEDVLKGIQNVIDWVEREGNEEFLRNN